MGALKAEARWLALFALIAGTGIACAMVAVRAGAPSPVLSTTLFYLLLGAWLLWCLLLIVWWLAKLALIEREARPLTRVSVGGAAEALGEQAARMGPAFVLAPFGLWFGVLKGLVPGVGGFRLDPFLIRCDRVLLGTDAWRITHRLFEPYTGLIDAVYVSWLPVTFSAAFAVAVFCRPEIRSRFFLSWTLGWLLLGVVTATALASVGPIFLADFGIDGAGDFAGLTKTLRQTDAAMGGAPGHPALFVLKGHDFLLGLHRASATGIGGGISSAPSLHVAIAALLVLTARRLSPRLTAVACLYFAFIAVGSVHLGWHYATDGILGTLGMVAIWTAIGAWLEQPGHRAAT